MVNRVSLDNVNPEQFDQLVDLLSEFILERRIKLRFWVPSAVELVFDPEWMSGLLTSKQLPVDACMSQLSVDIPLLLSAVLTGRRIGAVWHLAQDTELTELETETEDNSELIRSELLERCTILEDKLVNEEIRHRYAVKATAKNNIMVGSEWEVVRRQSDSTNDSLEGLVYANFSLLIQESPSFVTGKRPKYKTITVILTSEELLDLQDNLRDALTAME